MVTTPDTIVSDVWISVAFGTLITARICCPVKSPKTVLVGTNPKDWNGPSCTVRLDVTVQVSAPVTELKGQPWGTGGRTGLLSAAAGATPTTAEAASIPSAIYP